MREFDIRAFMNLAREIEDQDVTYGAIEAENEVHREFGEAPTAKLNDDELKELSARVERMAAFTEQINLHTSHTLLKARRAEPPKSQGEWRILIEAIYAEMKGQLVLYVPPERARFFKLACKPETAAAFPVAAKEIQLAGRSLAAGLFTASVFHSMRAGEIGVRALSKSLNVQFTVPAELIDWHNHQLQIQGALKKIKDQQKSLQRDADMEFYSKAAAQLQYFNDGWRIRVAHARASYDEGEALSVLNHVVALVDFLAIQLKEPV